MKKRTFDIIVILFIALALTILNEFSLLDGYSKFALVPLIAFYFIGQYSEKRFG